MKRILSMMMLVTRAVWATEDDPCAEFCYYDGSRLPETVKQCYKKPPTDACYFNYASNYTDIDPAMINHKSFPGMIIICGNLPPWVTEKCAWVNEGKGFQCGPKNDPLFNMRVIMHDQLLDIGTLDFDKTIWNPDELPIGDFAVEDQKNFMTHGAGCWFDREVREPLGNMRVTVTLSGSWGNLERGQDQSHPVVMDHAQVRNWLIGNLQSAMESIKSTNSYRIYSGCVSGGGLENHCSRDTRCLEWARDGCGHFFQESPAEPAIFTACPKYCFNTTPCKDHILGIKMPRTLEAKVFDMDRDLGDNFLITFEAENQVDTCGIEERLLTLLPSFLPPWGGKMPGILIFTPTSTDCDTRFHTKPASEF